MCTNRKLTALAALLIVASAAVTGGVLLATRATDAIATVGDNTANLGDSGLYSWNNSGRGFGIGEFDGRHGLRGRHSDFGQIVISDEYKQNALNIANNDTDVQNLLAEGYNITSIRPIISNVIDGEGYVTTKAATAYLLLQKDTSSLATAKVDLEQAKVTEIVVLARTVIEKP